MQSIIFGCAWFLFNIVSAVVHAVFGAIPGIGGILVFFWAIIAALVHLVFLVIMIITIVKAFTVSAGTFPTLGRSREDRWKTPPEFVGRLYRRLAFRRMEPAGAQRHGRAVERPSEWSANESNALNFC